MPRPDAPLDVHVEAQRERDRLLEVAALLTRHGWRGLAARLGLAPRAEEPRRPVGGRPEALVAVLRDLGPVAVKLGQILATREDLLGPEWIAALSTLHDRVEPVPYAAVADALRDAIGGAPEEVFASFDRTPIAAASIAQVYGAELADGTRVVVKVRRPGVARTVDADLRLLRRLARIAERQIPDVARLRPDELLRHFSESLAREMDLAAEARSAEEIGVFLDALHVRTPRVHWEFTTHLVNVQERLDGMPVSAVPANAPVPDGERLARDYAQAVLRMIIFNGHFHADPHPGNVWLLPDGTLGFIDFGAVGRLTPVRRSELVRLILAIAADDVAGVVDVLLQWTAARDIDRKALERDIAQLVGRFKGAVLAEIAFADIFADVFRLLRSHQLALPPDLALLLRTLLTAEGFVRRLAPGFDIGGELAPIARELLSESMDPRRWARSGRRALSGVARLLGTTPQLLAHLERVGRTGQIEVTTDAGPQREIARAVRRGARRISLAIAGAAVAISGALIAEWALVPGSLLMAAALVLLALAGRGH